MLPAAAPPVFTLQTHGQAAQPVMVVEGFAPRPEALMEDAAMLGFAPIGPYYPGVRAVVSPVIVRRLVAAWGNQMAEVFKLAGPPDVVEAYYSLVTTPPETLAPIQRLPHYDSVDPSRIALLLYLDKREIGGTAFFRHRSTGLESVSADQQQFYKSMLEKDVATYGLPSADYISGDTALFEQIAHYAAKFNRAIIYRGHTLHCADIPRGLALPADPLCGRFTINIFLQGIPTQ